MRWDAAAGSVESMTGELTWNYGERYVEVRAEQTQGLVGFAGGRTHSLPAVDIELDTPFASLLVTALDGQPLAESSHMLVTALARDRQLGATYSADGTQLESVGGPPLLLEPVQARLTFKGAGPGCGHGRRTSITISVQFGDIVLLNRILPASILDYSPRNIRRY